MTATATATATASSATLASPRSRLGMLRVGLVAAAVLGVIGLVPVFGIGFDGSGWDIVLVVLAVVAVLVAVGTTASAVLGWNGRRGPAILTCVLLVVSNLPAVPAFLLPAEETGAEGPGRLLAVLGILLSGAAIALVVLGQRRPR